MSEVRKLPELSIIMPFRNAGKWLCETIESILNQDFIAWELIAVDDFSTDDGAGLIKELAQTDSRIVYRKNIERGIIPALRHGLNSARGTYITRMDADDLMPQGRLSLFVSTIQKLPRRYIVTGKVQYFSNKEVSEGYRTYEKWLNTRIDLADHFDHVYRECVIASPNWMVRKEDLIEDHIFEEMQYPEDYSMVLQWKSKAYQVKGLAETSLLWREHPERTSRNSIIYQQQSFFKLKISHFFSHELNERDQLSILGAGVKGKLIAGEVQKHGLKFSWHDQNYARYKAGIYETEIQAPEQLKGDKLLIAIYPKNQKSLVNFLEQKGFRIGLNAWFC